MNAAFLDRLRSSVAEGNGCLKELSELLTRLRTGARTAKYNLAAGLRELGIGALGVDSGWALYPHLEGVGPDTEPPGQRQTPHLHGAKDLRRLRLKLVTTLNELTSERTKLHGMALAADTFLSPTAVEGPITVDDDLDKTVHNQTEMHGLHGALHSVSMAG